MNRPGAPSIAVALMCATASLSGGGCQPTDAGGSCNGGTIEVVEGGSLTLPSTMMGELKARRLDGCGLPVAGATVHFVLDAACGGSTLSVDTVITGADGVAVVRLFAGSGPARFGVRAVDESVGASANFAIELTCDDHCGNQVLDCGEAQVDCGGGCPGNCDPKSGLAPPAVYRTPDTAGCLPKITQACTASDMTYVEQEYGSKLTRADDANGTVPVYRLVAMVEDVGPSSTDVFVVDGAGKPLENVAVALSWPDAPETSRSDEPYPKKYTVRTGPDGRSGLALGSGAFIYACGGGGPHAVWISEPGAAAGTTVASDCADKLGWVYHSNHRHMNLLFQRIDPGAGAPSSVVRCPL